MLSQNTQYNLKIDIGINFLQTSSLFHGLTKDLWVKITCLWAAVGFFDCQQY
jgi:hypothetical protein